MVSFRMRDDKHHIDFRSSKGFEIMPKFVDLGNRYLHREKVEPGVESVVVKPMCSICLGC